MVAQGFAPAIQRFGAFTDIVVVPGWAAQGTPEAGFAADFGKLMLCRSQCDARSARCRACIADRTARAAA